MTQTHITWFLTVSAKGATADDSKARARLEEHLDQVMEELVKLEACHERIYDPSVGADFTKFPAVEVEIELLVDGDDDKALPVGKSAVRTAIHAAGGTTLGWEASDEDAPRYQRGRVALEPA